MYMYIYICMYVYIYIYMYRSWITYQRNTLHKIIAGFRGSWKSILHKEMDAYNAYNFFNSVMNLILSLINLNFIVVKYHLLNDLDSELKSKRCKLRKLKRIVLQDYLQKHVLARYMEP